ncbi:MAG: outer membrane lipoprotein-sorting protein [Bdellovibrio sp.]|nr:outer membrane lipoprotein-sorting protein [Bdellovibrio sp.]
MTLKDSKTVIVFNRTVAALCVLLFLFGAYTSLQTKTEFSLKQFYPSDHPLLLEEEKIAQLFKIEKNLSVIVLLQTKDKTSWLENKNFNDLNNLTTAFQKNEKLKSAISIANLQGAQDSGEQLDVGPLFENLAADKRKSIANSHPFVKPHLLARNESSTLLVLNLLPTSPLEVNKYTESLKDYFKTEFAGYDVSIGGLSVLQADMSYLLKKELFRSVFIGLILFILGLLVIYKKPIAVFSVLTTLVFVNVVILGFLAWFKIPLNVLLSTLPVLISLQVISLVIHIQGHHNKSTRIWLTYQDLFWENLLAVLISGVGFLFLKTSSSQLIQNYGVIVALSSFAAWFLTHLVYWPVSSVFSNTYFRSWLVRPAYWSLWSLRHRKKVLVSGLFVFFLGGYSITKVNWNARALDDLPEHQNTRKTTEFMDKNFGGTMDMNFVVHRPKKKNDWNHARSIKKLDLALNKIKQITAVGSVLSVNDFYKSLANPNQQKNRLPASNADVSEKNFLFSLGQQNPIESHVSKDKKDLLIKVRYQDVPSDQIQKTTLQIVSVLKKYFPEANVTSSGFAEQFHTMNQEISKDLVFNFWHAIVLAGLILVIAFKSWRFAILACLPNLLPPLVLMIWLNYQQVSLKPTVAIIFSIAIGLAFANTVYVIGRIIKLQKMRPNAKNYLPLKRALLEEGNPCLLATLLIVLGFVVFLFSYFGVNRLFGQYMILSVVTALIGDLIFMPSFLQQFKKYFISATILFFVFPNVSEAQTTAVEILKKSQSMLSSKDDSATIKMKIIEADGSSKDRELTFKRKFADKKNQTIVKILRPTDQRGAGFLNVVDDGSEQQWIYLPSSKQVRRFVSKNKQEGVLGSELSPQDLDLATIQSSTAKLLKKEKSGASEVALIEVTSKANQTAYSKAIVWVHLGQFVPLRIDFYDAKGQVQKRIDFQNYVKINQVQRAQKVVIKNMKNKRSTELSLSSMKVNSGLKDDVFTQRALSKD